MRALNLDQVTAFLDVVELGSFSAAAERVGLSQPAISLQVRQLEKRLGVVLLERVGRTAQPTSAGDDFLEYARELVRVSEAGLDAMAPHASGVMGRVRIGTGASACIYLLPPILKPLKRRFPSLEITVSVGHTSECVRGVEANAIDVGFVTLPAVSRAIEVTPVMEERFVFVGPPDFQAPPSVDCRAIGEQPMLSFEPSATSRQIIDDWFARGGVTPKTVMSLGSVEAIKELVGAGLGCAVLPEMAVRSLKPRQAVIRPLDPPLSRTLAIIARKDKKLHRGLRETIAALKTLSGSAT